MQIQKSYSEEERQTAICLSNDIGVKAASVRLGIKYSTIRHWRDMVKKHGQTTEPKKSPKPQSLAEIIEEAVNYELERGRYYSLYDMGDDGEVSAAAKKKTRERLRAFPDVCLRAQETESAEAIALNCEISAVKRALRGISGDEYYRIVPDMHFHKLNIREVSFRANCDLSTVRKHEERLIGELALLLCGVEARWRITNEL